MTKNKSISYNYAMVADGLHRGAGTLANKNIPDGSGNLTFSSSLYFLYDKKEEMLKNKKKSMLVGVLNCSVGLDPVKKRLNSYGMFGKKIQNNPNKFDEENIETIFLWGQNISGFEISKIDNAIVALEKKLGDSKATRKNHKKSPKYKEALEMSKNANMLVVAHYDESFFNVDEDNDSMATLSMGYVKFGTGRIPIISSFEHPTKDGLVEAEWFGNKYSDYLLDPEGSISMVTTRSYLKDFDGSGYDNLKSLTKKDDENSSFWVVQIADFEPEKISAEFASSFSQDILEKLKDVDSIRFSYIMTKSESKTIDDILNIEENGDAVIVFTGLIEADISNDKRIQFYTTEPDQEGNTKTYATFRLRRGTFYTQKLIK